MSNDAELIESTIQTIAHLTHSSNTLQDKLRADAASGECVEWTNLTLIAAADRIDELERQLAEAQKDQADAKRYRWLRDNTLVDGEINEEMYVAVDSDKFPGQWALVENNLDQAIDAAMKVKP